MAYGHRFVPGVAGIPAPAPAPAPAAPSGETQTAQEIIKERKRLNIVISQEELMLKLARRASTVSEFKEACYDEYLLTMEEVPPFDGYVQEPENAINKVIADINKRLADLRAELAALEASDDSDQLKELKRFRELLDTKTLREAIDTIEEELDSDDWWSNGIIEGFQDSWTELFDRLLGEDSDWDETDEKNKEIWKRFFDELIKNIENPGAPPPALDPEKIDSVEDKVTELEKRVTELTPVPGPAPAPEPAPEAWPEVIPGKPEFPSGTGGITLQECIAHLSVVREYVRHLEQYHEKVLFNMCWCLEMTRVCLNELKAAKAPGSQTDNFINNLAGLKEGTFELETKGVFHD